MNNKPILNNGGWAQLQLVNEIRDNTTQNQDFPENQNDDSQKVGFEIGREMLAYVEEGGENIYGATPDELGSIIQDAISGKDQAFVDVVSNIWEQEFGPKQFKDASNNPAPNKDQFIQGTLDGIFSEEPLYSPKDVYSTNWGSDWERWDEHL